MSLTVVLNPIVVLLQPASFSFPKRQFAVFRCFQPVHDEATDSVTCFLCAKAVAA